MDEDCETSIAREVKDAHVTVEDFAVNIL